MNAEKSKLENKIEDFCLKYVEKGIPVPSDGEYEIENGIIGGKRDLLLRLTRDLKDEDIQEVLFVILPY
jgi:hypothetical protein